MGYGVGGLVSGRSAEKHTSLGSRAGLTIQCSIVPSDGRPSELDAVSEVKSLSHWGPCELHCAAVPLVVGHGRLPRMPPSEGTRLRFRRRRRTMSDSVATCSF